MLPPSSAVSVYPVACRLADHTWWSLFWVTLPGSGQSWSSHVWRRLPVWAISCHYCSQGSDSLPCPGRDEHARSQGGQWESGFRVELWLNVGIEEVHFKAQESLFCFCFELSKVPFLLWKQLFIRPWQCLLELGSKAAIVRIMHSLLWQVENDWRKWSYLLFIQPLLRAWIVLEMRSRVSSLKGLCLRSARALCPGESSFIPFILV